jgi:hypothetical protein
MKDAEKDPTVEVEPKKSSTGQLDGETIEKMLQSAV